MQKTTVYSRKFCSYCTAAKSLLREAGYEFEEISLDADPEKAATVMGSSGMRTVPIILLGEKTLGGFRELYAAMNSGKFADMMSEQQSGSGNQEEQDGKLLATKLS